MDNLKRRRNPVADKAAAEAEDFEYQRDIVFDDAPIADIVYGGKSPAYTSADVYPHAKRYLKLLLKAIDDKNTDYALDLLAVMQNESGMLTEKSLLCISAKLCGLMPFQVHPVIKEDVSYLGPMLAVFLNMLSEAREIVDVKVIDRVGLCTYRWHEHAGHPEEGVPIIERLLKIVTEESDPRAHAVLLNNLGYEYIMLQEYERAVPYLERAIMVFERLKNSSERLNSRLNLLRCKAELIDDNELPTFLSLLSKLSEAHEVEAQHKFHFVKYLVLRRMGEPKDAADECRIAMERSEKSSSNFFEIYKRHFQDKDLD